jgi:hypothetical protein
MQDLTPEGCERKVQGQFGIEYREKSDTFIIFEVQLFDLNSVVGSNGLIQICSGRANDRNKFVSTCLNFYRGGKFLKAKKYGHSNLMGH